MRVEIHGDKIKVTDSIKSKVNEKLDKLDQYFEKPEELKAYVVIRAKNNLETIEVTIPTPKFTLRTEVSDEDLYASIDLSIDKLERQIRKNKTKMRKKFKDVLQYEMLQDRKIEENKSQIVKRKSLELRPMDEEEAALQMELVDHDFFIFKNIKTDGISVLYKRKGGSYGIIDVE